MTQQDKQVQVKKRRKLSRQGCTSVLLTGAKMVLSEKHVLVFKETVSNSSCSHLGPHK